MFRTAPLKTLRSSCAYERDHVCRAAILVLCAGKTGKISNGGHSVTRVTLGSVRTHSRCLLFPQRPLSSIVSFGEIGLERALPFRLILSLSSVARNSFRFFSTSQKILSGFSHRFLAFLLIKKFSLIVIRIIAHFSIVNIDSCVLASPHIRPPFFLVSDS